MPPAHEPHPTWVRELDVIGILARCGNIDEARLACVTGPLTGHDALRLLDARGFLDRVAARAIAQVLDGGLPERDLKQVLDLPTLRKHLDQIDSPVLLPKIQPLPLPLNSYLGHYAIKGLLGCGASSHVYRSIHPHLQIPVALKVSNDAGSLHAEAAVLVRLSHPSIVRVWDVEQVGRLTILVLEYLDGESLARAFSQGRGVDPTIGFRAARDMVRALHAAHKCGVVHGDVKPANVIATSSGRFKLVDFGTATKPVSLPTSGEILEGSWPYAAPECFNRPGDPRSDVYSLGLTLYHALSGRAPVTAQGFTGCRDEHASLNLDPLHWTVPGVGRSASDLIRRMTHFDPTNRPTGSQLLSDENGSHSFIPYLCRKCNL